MQQAAATADVAEEPRTERVASFNCLVCNDTISCPSGVVEWAWYKSDAVRDFREKHKNCPPNAVGAEVKTIAKE